MFLANKEKLKVNFVNEHVSICFFCGDSSCADSCGRCGYCDCSSCTGSCSSCVDKNNFSNYHLKTSSVRLWI